MKKTSILLTFFILALSSTFVKAMLVKPLSLAQMSALASVIVRGQSLGCKVQDDPFESQMIVRYCTFKVDEVLKGRVYDSTLTIKQVIQGVPLYEEGKTYVLFLPRASSKTGLLAPLGIDQGVYELQKQNDRWLVKGFSPELKKTTPGLHLSTTSSLGGGYEAFKSLILKEVGAPR